MFKKMLVHICKECFRKLSCIACIDCYKETSHLRPKKVLPPEQGNLPIKEYFKLFKAYGSTLSLDNNHPGLKNLFIRGLSHENKKELEAFPFLDVSPLIQIVAYLSEVEASKRRPKIVLPPEQGDLPIKEYFKLIETYILASDVSIDSKKAREIFLIGLNDDTKKELPPFYAVRSLTDILSILSEVEVFKRNIPASTEGQIIEDGEFS